MKSQMMLSTGTSSLREHTLKQHSRRIENLFPRVLAYLISEFCIPYDVEFQPYSTAGTAKNEKERNEMLIDFEGSITGLITTGNGPGSLNQTLRTPWKPYHWLTWVGTQPLSKICNSCVFKTCIGVATRESIARFRDFHELEGSHFYTESPRTVFMQSNEYCGFISTPTSVCFDRDDCLETGDQINLTVQPASATESHIWFTLRCGTTIHVAQHPTIIPTTELDNYVPFILTHKRVRLLISCSEA